MPKPRSFDEKYAAILALRRAGWRVERRGRKTYLNGEQASSWRLLALAEAITTRA